MGFGDNFLPVVLALSTQDRILWASRQPPHKNLVDNLLGRQETTPDDDKWLGLSRSGVSNEH